MTFICTQHLNFESQQIPTWGVRDMENVKPISLFDTLFIIAGKPKFNVTKFYMPRSVWKK